VIDELRMDLQEFICPRNTEEIAEEVAISRSSFRGKELI
jgi:hypothetical protein